MRTLTFWWAVLVGHLHWTLVTASVCPFDEECLCEKDTTSKHSFKSINCEFEMCMKRDFGGPARHYKVATLAISGCMLGIDKNTFQALKSVDRLHLALGGTMESSKPSFTDVLANVFDELAVKEVTYSATSDGFPPTFPANISEDSQAVSVFSAVNLEHLILPRWTFLNISRLSSLVFGNITFLDMDPGALRNQNINSAQFTHVSFGEFPSQTFANAAGLSVLYLVNVMETRFSASAFADIPGLSHLVLSGDVNRTLQVKSETFQRLPPQLVAFQCNFAQLERVPDGVRALQQLQILQFIGCEIDELKLDDVPSSCTTVEFSENPLLDISPPTRPLNVQTLTLDRLKLPTVDLSAFRMMKRLEKLSFDKCNGLRVHVSDPQTAPESAKILLTNCKDVGLDESVDDYLRSDTKSIIDMTKSTVNCTFGMTWMRYHSENTGRLKINETTCLNYCDLLLSDFLQDMVVFSILSSVC